ncbi:helix-turn-helix transcriptional regulator [Paenibacillus sp. IB182496]|uniref:Helix-turn-helix transcriptional regulator n=1 Tax=Paenibacillus sabuli TaxID=2772509 RepID=A0A927BR54_9BACL|nr:helix-turn-helix domain-containing protein [Paenibacillus sabuli]MBD2844180.1 helix-turn-helix transcriptional regulator [Paenibacillus sabuli]
MQEHPRDGQARLLWTARVDYPAGSAVEPHRHEGFSQLLVVLEGGGELRADGGVRPLDKRCCCVLPAGLRHGLSFSEPSITLDFKFVLTENGLAEWMGRLPRTFDCSDEDLTDLKRVFKLSLRQLLAPEPLLPLRIDGLFKSTLLGLIPGSEAASHRCDPALVPDFPMAAYLAERLDRRVPLEELAAQYNFHRHYIISLFRQRTGMTPIRYHQTLRLAKAKEYLEFTDWTVSEIADRLGWSLPYMSRLFHREIRLSPAAYRSYALHGTGTDIVLEDGFVNQWRVTPAPALASGPGDDEQVD